MSSPAKRTKMLPSKFYIFAFLCFREIFAEVLTPPYFNIAANKKVEATYTCGEDVDEPELYCKLVGAVQDTNDRDKSVIRGQVCDYCDSHDPEKRHPPNYAVDGTENYWLSPPLSRGTDYNKVNFTIDLGQEFHVAYIIIKMGISPRPGLWVLERSSDNGKTYKPWQYFAERDTDCETFFGVESLKPITNDDSVICTTQFSKIVPLEHGEIVVSLLNDRPSSTDFFNSTALQEWTRATNVRLSLLRTQTLYGHLMSVERQDPTVTRRYFYSIKDISIGGRCRCNGHAVDCIETQEDKYKLKCVCQHDTCGDNCDKCCPNKVQKAWQQSKANKLFVCEGCNCHGHSNQCVYNETVDKLHLSLDLSGNYEGGGVCIQCRDNTEGINCEKCKPGFFLPHGVDIKNQNACSPCNCTGQQYTGNCEHGTGRCECKQNYVSPFCDACSFGYTNYPECEPCRCNVNGTINEICDPINNICPCKPNYDGPQCAYCSKGSYDFPNCKRCNCNKIGSLDDFCNPLTGDCECKNNYTPPKCDTCTNGYFAFPECNLCNCNKHGTVDEVCDKNTGKCLCKEGYTGENCGECVAGFKNFPNCESCNCTEIGSQSLICDSNGKCPCLEKFSGQTCNECSPGYYNYPQCTPCNCDPYGTQGKSCDNEGNCKCRENFHGKHCDKCNEGLYNYPICEACDCDPAGVTANFTGCGKIKGELCQCKPRVEGRKCNECKPLYWNLQNYNPHGCSDCECHLPGVIGGIAECNSKKRGQCYCKKSVISRKCDQCADGSYNLQENNIFGCTDCGCDIGGALPNACNKTTGQCICRNRITGRTCDRPDDVHYFPTLYQLKFEAEDWKSVDNENARIDFDENIFPDFSWRGYAILASTQKLIRQRIYIEYMSFYQIIVRYVNKNDVAISGVIKLKESATEDVQMLKVVFPPSQEPSFITVGGEQGNIPSTHLFISESRGMWEISLETPLDAPPLFIDYVVLMPDSYYEGNTLVEHVKNPCKSGEKSSCLFYEYPSVENFISAKPIGLSNEYLNFADAWHPPVPILSAEQREMGLNVPAQDDKELKVIVVNYATPLDINETATLNVNIYNGVNSSEGIINLTPCHYNFLCRQVVLDKEGRVAKFQTSDTPLEILFKNSGAPKTAIENVVLIPTKDWNFDYVSPSVSCIMKNSECLDIQYPLPVGMKKIEFETELEINKPKTTYPKVLDPSVVLLRSDESSEIVINGKVPSPGNFLFIVHYYQPISPEITTPVLIETDYSYNGTLKFQHCPSQVGCRSVIYGPRSDLFYASNEFNITFRENRTVWLDYVLIVPENQFKSYLLKQEAVNNAERFKAECGANHFYVDVKTTTEFCKKAIFSLTSDFNNGALKCQCNHLGSKNFTCALFGGQCQCRDFVIGRKCEECKANYWGFPNCKPCECAEWATCDKETGQCTCPKNIEGDKCDKCKPYTYDFNFYSGCLDCNCHPSGVKDNNLQCDLTTGHCTCKENVDGRKCDKCKAGYHSFPYCEECDCDRRGTTDEICDAYGSGECSCKRNVEGVVCDLCAPGTYNLDSENPDGCTECFCFNRTSECSSSRFYWDSLKGLEDWGLVAIKVKSGLGISVSELSTAPESIPPAIGVDLTAEEIGDQEIYFRTSEKYLGNKLRSYGGRLKYSIFCTTGISGKSIFSSDIIFSGAGIDLFYSSEALPNAAELFEINLLIKESNFKLSNNLAASRGHLMQVLQDLQAIYIKATYWEKSVTTRIQNFSMDVSSQKYTNNGVALSIEQCSCPPQYSGLSCEECADGYYRSSTGSFGGFCVPCQCNGHAATCDKVTGVCQDCDHDTSGDHCEKCSEGFYGDATYGTPWDCNICACPLPIPKNNFAKSCEVSDDGSRISCNCNEGYYGHRCQSCANGYYGNPEIENDYCKPCECSGNINITDVDACDSVSGECIKCLSNTAGPACNYCKPGFYGDAVKLKNCQSCSCHDKGTFRCDHSTGACECHPNVEGEKCDRCAENHYLFDSGQGCIPCNCANASISKQCDDTSGQCRCQPGVTGRSCEKCDQGYWNYTSQGCTKCLCNLQNSIKVGCNENGQCECLKDVIGEKCDGCPDRWVFVEKEGCFPCGKCVHDLLDTVDVIKERLEPISNEFETVAKSYFIQRRLQYLNETAIALRPSVNNIGDSIVNLAPTQNKFDELQQEVDRISRKNAYTILKANGTANDSLVSQSSALDEDVKKEIELAREAIQGAKETVTNVIQIGNSFEEPSVLDLTQQEALEEAKSIYDALKQKFDPNNRKFITKESVQLSYLERAESSLKDVEKFKEPVDEREKSIQAVGKRIEDLRKRVKDANRLALESLKSSKKLSDKTQENIRMSLPSKYETINKQVELSKAMMLENNKLLDNISSLLAMSSSDLYSKFKGSKEEFIPLTEDLVKLTDTKLTTDAVRNASISVSKAEKWANALERDANELKQIGEQPVTDTSEALIYNQIINALRSAIMTAERAKLDAEEAKDITSGIGSNASSTYENSNKIFEKADALLKEAKTNLSNYLNSTVNEVKQLENEKDKIIADLDSTDKILDSMEIKRNNEDFIVDMENADRAAKDIISETKTMANELSDLLNTTKNMSAKKRDAESALAETNRTLDDIKKIVPNVNILAEKLKNRPEQMKVDLDNLKEKLKVLNDQVALAREAANKIPLVASFDPKTTLELSKPNDLPDQAINNLISLYFKTREPNALIFFIGNPASNERRNKRTASDGEFMALEVQNGEPKLTVDLGSGPTSVITKIDVSNDHWHQAIMERTGKVIRLTIIPPNRQAVEAEDFVAGTSFVLNLDKSKSKIFVGGIPASFNTPPHIQYNYFDGSIDGLVIGDTPVSLWNFIEKENLQPDYKRGELGNVSSAIGCSFNGYGYVALPREPYKMDTKSQISLSFQTKAKEGLLFLAHQDDNFISIELREGRVFHQFDLGNGVVTMSSSKPYNDNTWHTVNANRLYSKGSLIIDGDMEQSLENDDDKSLFKQPEKFYIGGYPGNHNIEHVTNMDFDGCINDVQLESIVNLNKNIESTGTKPGCPPKFDRVVSFEAGAPGYLLGPNITADDNTMELLLSFRTTSPDGLLAYAWYGSPSITLSLRDGQLFFRSGTDEVLSDSPKPYNDGNWHAVTAHFDEDKMELNVDDKQIFTSTEPPKHVRMLHGQVYFGGVPSSVDAETAFYDKFVGCISDATLNNVIVNFASTTESSQAIIGKCAFKTSGIPPPPIQPKPRPSEPPIIPDKPVTKPDKTTTTPPPISRDDNESCKLPLYPNIKESAENVGYRLGTRYRSRIEYMALPGRLKAKYDFSIEIKTEAQNGVIFFASNKRVADYISLFLRDGQVVYIFNCGSGEAYLTSEGTINDNKWHSVAFKRNGEIGTLIVDDNIVSQGRSEGTTKTLNVTAPYFIGGLDTATAEVSTLALKGVNESLDGCVRNFKVNGQLVTKARNEIGVIPCSDDEFEHGIYFAPEGGYVKQMEKFSVGKRFDAMLTVKPRVLSGLLLAIHGKKDYFVLELVDGAVVAKVFSSNTNIVNTYIPPLGPNYLCDGNWHKITVSKQLNLLTLGIDAMFSEPIKGENKAKIVQTKHTLYLGGNPEKNLPGVTSMQYVGCIKDVVINQMSEKINVKNAIGNVTSNACPIN